MFFETEPKSANSSRIKSTIRKLNRIQTEI